MNKPVYLGMATLDISKTFVKHLYKFMNFGMITLNPSTKT